MRLEFFWSARTLRLDRIEEQDGIPTIQTEDVLGVDQQRSIFAYGDYGPLIVRLLNEHFERQSALPIAEAEK
jgi:hypothetical protein